MKLKVFLLVFLALFLNEVMAADITCSSCSECDTELQTLSSNDRLVLNSNVNLDNGTCLNFTEMSDKEFSCNGYSIDGLDNRLIERAAILVYNSSDIVITDCDISNFYYGIYIEASNSTSVSSSDIQNCVYGLTIQDSFDGSFTNNNLLENEELDFDYNPFEEAQCNSYFSGNVGSGNRPIGVYNSASSINGAAFSSLFLCNADGLTLSDSEIFGSSNYRNNELGIVFSDNVEISNLTFVENNNIFSHVSDMVTVRDSLISNNSKFGIDLFFSNYWNILNNTFFYNVGGDIRLFNSDSVEVNYNIFNSSYDIVEDYSYSLDFDNNYWTNNESSGFSDTCWDVDYDGVCGSSYSSGITDNFPLSRYHFIEAPSCIPDWSCSSFTDCQIINLRVCQAMTDNNNCGILFGGDVNDYSQACVYSSPGDSSEDDTEDESDDSGSDSAESSSVNERYSEKRFNFVALDSEFSGDVDLDGIALKRYVVRTARDVYDVVMRVVTKDNLDDSVPELSNVISSFEINHVNLDDDDISSATVEFEIDSKYDSYEIFLYRYLDGDWEKNNCTRVSISSKLSLYSCEINGFSYFSIVYGKELPVTLSDDISLDDSSEYEKRTERTFRFIVVVWISLFILFAALIVSNLLKNRELRSKIVSPSYQKRVF